MSQSFKLRDYQEEAAQSPFIKWETDKRPQIIVAPTGSGKSAILARFIVLAHQMSPDTRFIVLSHVSEILVQNAKAILVQWPDCRITFYSDKLGQKDSSGQVVLATIQSYYKQAYNTGSPVPELVIVDECHLIPADGNTMYRRFLSEMKIACPDMNCIGLSASPFRAKTGLLHKGKDALFGDICYEIGILDLIEQGYLCPIITPSTRTRMDVSGVKIQGGDYVQKHLESAVDRDEITIACVDEIIEHGADRKTWLIFTAGVSHCTHVRDEIRSRGISCEMVIGDTSKTERDDIIGRHKRGELRCVVNVNTMTTGVDNPAIDLLAFMRPTRSPVMYIQCAGRGMRTHPSKSECLLLDFADVVSTLGPIDQIRLPNKKKGEGEAPSKACPECGEKNHAAARLCIQCGFEFPAPEIKIGHTASEAAVLSTQLRTETYPVTSVSYRRHKKEGKPDTFCVEYMSGMTKSFRSWWCLEHSSSARELAAFWWRRAAKTKEPNTITEALARTKELRKPVSVTVKKVGKYHEVVGVQYE